MYTVIFEVDGRAAKKTARVRSPAAPKFLRDDAA